VSSRSLGAIGPFPFSIRSPFGRRQLLAWCPSSIIGCLSLRFGRCKFRQRAFYPLPQGVGAGLGCATIGVSGIRSGLGGTAVRIGSVGPFFSLIRPLFGLFGPLFGQHRAAFGRGRSATVVNLFGRTFARTFARTCARTCARLHGRIFRHQHQCPPIVPGLRPPSKPVCAHSNGISGQAEPFTRLRVC
jgi:hypothetical protein